MTPIWEWSTDVDLTTAAALVLAGLVAGLLLWWWGNRTRRPSTEGKWCGSQSGRDGRHAA